jgi:hypothetical protein
MYILRHPGGGLPPLTVSRAPGGGAAKGRLEMIATPTTQGAILRDGADCIVLHVMDAPVEFLVSAFLPHAGASVPALRVDQIGLDKAATAPAAAAPAPATAGRRIQVSAKGISIIAHVERTGDVVAGEGARVGDPSSNRRIEGFQLMWPDRPAGVELAYSVAVEGVGAMPVVGTGKFCGTREQARRITEVTIALVGPQAEQFRLEGSAHFSGGFQVALTPGIAASGPSGLEHLTALSLRAVAAGAAPEKARNPWEESPRTKVFKAKAAVTKAAPDKKPASKAAKTQAA